MQDMAGWIAMKPEFHGQSLHVLQIPSFILGPKHSGKCSTLLGAGPMYNRFRDSHYSRIDRYELHILISSGSTHNTSVTRCGARSVAELSGGNAPAESERLGSSPEPKARVRSESNGHGRSIRA